MHRGVAIGLDVRELAHLADATLHTLQRLQYFCGFGDAPVMRIAALTAENQQLARKKDGHGLDCSESTAGKDLAPVMRVPPIEE